LFHINVSIFHSIYCHWIATFFSPLTPTQSTNFQVKSPSTSKEFQFPICQPPTQHGSHGATHERQAHGQFDGHVSLITCYSNSSFPS